MKREFSRRAALQTGLGAVLLPLLTSSAASAKDSDLLSSLEVTLASDEASIQTIKQNYPGLIEDHTGGTLLSLFHLVSNSASHNVSAMTVRWGFTTSTETSEALDVYVIPSIYGHWYTGTAPLIRKQSVRLFSPFFSWSPQQYQSLPKPLNWTSLLAHNEVTRFRSTSLLKDTQHAEMKIDSVIWANRVISGPVNGFLAKHFIVTRNGEHDAAYAVQQQLEHGQNYQQIDQFLSRQFVGMVPEPRNSVHQRYDAARRRQSGFLLNALRTQNSNEFRETIRGIAHRRRTVLIPANS
jgi:hypothetical protein